MDELIQKGKACKNASHELMNLDTEAKNQILNSIAENLKKAQINILSANQKDIEQARKNKRPKSFVDRLALNEERLNQIIKGVHQVISLLDPCNNILDKWKRGELSFTKKSVPIGVIGIIYEARPNVSVDATALCLKAGNVCFLRGSKDAIHSNKALVSAMKQGIIDAGYNEHFVELLNDTSKECASAFMKLNAYLDVLIPRGSANLIKATLDNASVPIIETGTGNCHVYVDKDADLEKALTIIVNAKCQRVSVCNACESIILHKDIIKVFVPKLIDTLKKQNVRIHADKEICKYDMDILVATEEDFAKEYLDYEISIKTVDGINEAIQHINKYGSHHSDVIVSENKKTITLFLNQIDSAVVYANASSRFSDGEEFGFGAEIGISTQKIHARGPMGLNALTTYKYIVVGDGTVRK